MTGHAALQAGRKISPMRPEGHAAWSGRGPPSAKQTTPGSPGHGIHGPDATSGTDGCSVTCAITRVAQAGSSRRGRHGRLDPAVGPGPETTAGLRGGQRAVAGPGPGSGAGVRRRHLAAAPAAVIFAVRQPGWAVLIDTPTALGGFWSGLMARIVTSWPDRGWPAGRGFPRARRPGPGRETEISASPPMTGAARP